MEVSAENVETEIEGLLDVGVAEAMALDHRLGLLPFAGDTSDLVVNHLAGEALKCAPQQCAFLLSAVLDDLLVVSDLALGDLGKRRDVLVQRFTGPLALLHGDRDGGVVVLDRLLNERDGLVALVAPALLLGGTDEVFVGRPAASGVTTEGQTPPAVPAVHGALEVVLVLAVALARGLVRCQHSLDAVEGLPGHERFVAARELLPLVGDDAHVVVIGE